MPKRELRVASNHILSLFQDNYPEMVTRKVSHHPPICAGHAENEHFTYDITSKVKTKFLGNSVEIYPVGRTRVTLKRSGIVLDLVPPPTKVNNLIFGRTWIDSPGELVMTNLTKCTLIYIIFTPNFTKVTAVVRLWSWCTLSLAFGSLFILYRCSRHFFCCFFVSGSLI